MTECPQCGARTAIHCNGENDSPTCDMWVCPACGSYGTNRRWWNPIAKKVVQS